MELQIFDNFFVWRGSSGLDPRIVVITYSESDIANMKKWPFPDSVVANLISIVQADNPRVIGLDMYRNLPVEPGSEVLKNVFRKTPTLIGAEKFVQPSVPPSPYLDYNDQVGFVDVVKDVDDHVRRGLLSIKKAKDHLIFSFPLKISLKYLAKENIFPIKKNEFIRLGKQPIIPLIPSQAGYISFDAGGYQTLINYRCAGECFTQISITDVLNRQFPKNFFDNRVVLIGSTAASLNDTFLTPYGKIAGVFIHANLISQFLSGALDGRQVIHTYPQWMEWIWIVLWALLGGSGFKHLLKLRILKQISFIIQIITFLMLSTCVILVIAYISFLCGAWLTVVPATCGFLLSSIIFITYNSQQLQNLSNIDELTQLANRRYFDNFLKENFRQNRTISLIICDIDHFKLYNDTYGHQQGDRCLRKVADAIAQSVRNVDLAARYGGEEFAVILPNTDHEVASRVATRIVEAVRALHLEHRSSLTKSYVTLSCGVACMVVDKATPSINLLINADRVLYKAKELGRDRVM